jgi:hypothetical protein
MTPPAAGAVRGNETRNDSVRPDLANQGRAAGQGTATGQGAANAPATSTMPPAATGTVTPGTTMPNRADTTGATTPNRGDAGGNNAVQLDSGTRTGPLEHGANSFTEGQARSRMEEAGFTDLQALRKDDNGIWRGRAMRAGQQVEVGLDYRGNVSPLTR